MFVDIENYKSPLKVENMLTPYTKGLIVNGVRQPKEPITPDVCFEVLKSTNVSRNINDMLQCIADLPASEQAQFKEVVLSTFTQRVQPDKNPYNIVLLGKKLAHTSGYEAELAEVQKMKDGFFLSSAPYVDKSVVTFKNSFLEVDLSSYDKIIFFSSDKIQFVENKNLRLTESVKLPQNMEFLNSSDVMFNNGMWGFDFKNVQRISFKDGAKVDIWHAFNLPVNLDFSRCDTVMLRSCYFSGVQSMLFKDGADVCLRGAKELPPNIDFSMCTKLELSFCELNRQQDLHFRDDAVVLLNNVKNLPPDIDFSQCTDVTLFNIALNKQSRLSFRNGAKVNLQFVQNLPSKLDFSMCSEVMLEYCNFRMVDCLIFKNRAQMRKSNPKIAKDWGGKLVFVDEPPKIQKKENIDASAQFAKSWRKFIGKVFGNGGR